MSHIISAETYIPKRDSEIKLCKFHYHGTTRLFIFQKIKHLIAFSAHR